MVALEAIQMGGETYYPVKQAAALLGMHYKTLYLMIREGEVAVPLRGRIRVSETEIKRILNGSPKQAVPIATRAELTRRGTKALKAVKNL